MRLQIERRPRLRKSGEVAYYTRQSLVRKREELALKLALVAHRYLFGLVYSGILPDFFDKMPYGSGVFVCPVVMTSAVAERDSKPGDIDLLVIPYEENELLLDQTLAIEIKVVRATYLNQGKSAKTPGFSQAKGLKEIGFPYVALVHLIVSDESPPEAWRPMGIARVLTSDGLVEMLPEMDVDWMPLDLLQRAYGRLQATDSDPSLGLSAVYLGSKDSDFSGEVPRSTWHPECRPASMNSMISSKLLENVGLFFNKNVESFMDIPRHDPK